MTEQRRKSQGEVVEYNKQRDMQIEREEEEDALARVSRDELRAKLKANKNWHQIRVDHRHIHDGRTYWTCTSGMEASCGESTGD